jgi:hypothetical protein
MRPPPDRGKIMDTPKVVCPTCNLVFAADHPAGPVACPMCDTRFTPAGATPPALGRPSRFRAVLIAGAVLLLLAGGAGLALYRPDLRGGRPPTAVPTPGPAAAPGAEAPVRPEVGASPPAAVSEPAFVPRPPPPPEPQAPLTRELAPAEPLPPGLAEAVNQAIDRGLAYLRQREGNLRPPYRPQGLLGLTLLECGALPTDPFVQQTAESLREQAVYELRTYELSTTIFFLDRLGAARDDSLIRALADRLCAGQTADGAWTYTCMPATTSASDAQGPVVIDSRRANARASAPGDHSNTQFATLALWVAQRHGARVREALARLEVHFRESQGADGSWAYRNPVPRNEVPAPRPVAQWGRSPFRSTVPRRPPAPPRRPAAAARGQWHVTGTCAGLLALGVGHGIDARGATRPAFDQDIALALNFLGQAVTGAVPPPGAPRALGLDGRDDLYTLWSLERTARVYDLYTLGGRPWYRWAAAWLVRTQAEDGSWRHVLQADVDTCFALLVLRRSNLAPDLTDSLRGRVVVPGREPQRASDPGVERTAPPTPAPLRAAPPPPPAPLRAAPADAGAPADPGPLRVAPAAPTKDPR